MAASHPNQWTLQLSADQTEALALQLKTIGKKPVEIRGAFGFGILAAPASDKAMAYLSDKARVASLSVWEARTNSAVI